MFRFLKNSRGILGINRRNLQFIRPYNRKDAKKYADRKILCKKLLQKNDIPTPRLIASIRNRVELDNFNWLLLPESFVLKPNRGFGGEGILIVVKKKKNKDDIWIKQDKTIVSIEDLKTHILNILDGSFSLSNIPDIAFFEERLVLSKVFKKFVNYGIPDVRIIVFNNVPIMAMLRIPTTESRGRANLHQGGIGVGIDMATGVTTSAIYRDNFIDYLPNTEISLSGIKIPYWKEILHFSVKSQEVSGLGFIGVDVAVDQEKGVQIIEINARPGLSIQLANKEGLLERLKRVEGLKNISIEKGVKVGMNLFGGEVEEEIETVSGKKIIGTIEKVKLIGKNGKEVEILAKIDTGAESSSIDIDLAKELGYNDLIKYFSEIKKPVNVRKEDEEKIKNSLRKKYLGKHRDLADFALVYSANGFSIRPKIKLNFLLSEINILGKISIANRKNLDYPMIIGKNNLASFLIDVSKKNYEKRK
ncbi:MAG: Alpha-L-glutamate ligase-like protein [Candidatus Berkelbacteria bacterium Licking1014_85]|uniref:Alpha-L-glutamate ligase-like protein n=1 Tax=Candidatus Berkelbacteria bacterium Licking1014_85 TaxID=2017148 RepID=A0A554LL76_9BACT|nr:MAG: Alpha-L-glutamate ligase-like protein [Candidatus Berkelbacteria bacterium Licking1014_85]